jgi:hypothetical protein
MIDSSPFGRSWTAFRKWSPVIALALCAGTLVASEFMPASLLTPIASDLQLTDGQTGRAISISGVFAVLTSLSVSSLTRGIDRRHLLLLMVGLMLVANLMVGLAPNAATFMAGRALIGVVIGAFWSMSAATVMRLVPVADVPKGLALVNGGNALVVTIATPLGSFLGQYTGWRGVFFLLLVPLSVLAFAWLFRTQRWRWFRFPGFAPTASGVGHAGRDDFFPRAIFPRHLLAALSRDGHAGQHIHLFVDSTDHGPDGPARQCTGWDAAEDTALQPLGDHSTDDGRDSPDPEGVRRLALDSGSSAVRLGFDRLKRSGGLVDLAEQSSATRCRGWWRPDGGRHSTGRHRWGHSGWRAL